MSTSVVYGIISKLYIKSDELFISIIIVEMGEKHENKTKTDIITGNDVPNSNGAASNGSSKRCSSY
jgi:hypothetical protein